MRGRVLRRASARGSTAATHGGSVRGRQLDMLGGGDELREDAIAAHAVVLDDVFTSRDVDCDHFLR